MEEILTLASELHNPQMELLLLRSCLGVPKINFLLRTLNPEGISDSIEHIDKVLAVALGSIIGGSHHANFDQSTIDIIHFPFRLGGLAVPQVSTLAPSAYLGARIDYYNSLLNSSEKDAALRELHTLFSVWKARFIPANVDLTLDDVLQERKPQKYLSILVSNHRYQSLIDSLPEGVQKSRLVSNAESKSRWLLVYPRFGLSAQNFPPLQFQMALRIWLGLPLGIFPSNLFAQPCHTSTTQINNKKLS